VRGGGGFTTIIGGAHPSSSRGSKERGRGAVCKQREMTLSLIVSSSLLFASSFHSRGRESKINNTPSAKKRRHVCAGSKSVFVETITTPLVNSLCSLQQLLSLSDCDDIRLSDNEIFIFLSRKGVLGRILRRRQCRSDAFLRELIKQNKEIRNVLRNNTKSNSRLPRIGTICSPGRVKLNQMISQE
jgi:hypothetical protein